MASPFPAALAASKDPRVQERLARLRQLSSNDSAVNKGGRPRGSKEMREDIEKVRKRLESQKPKTGQNNEDNQDTHMVPVQDSTSEVLSLLPLFESQLQQKILRHVVFARESGQCDQIDVPSGEVPENLAQALFGLSEHIMSKTILATMMSASRQTASRRLSQVACSAMQLMNMKWTVLFSKALDMITHGGFEGLVIGRVRKYDESPFGLRVNDAGQLFRMGSNKNTFGMKIAASNAKVLSSKHRLFMLLRRPRGSADGSFQYCLLHGDAPSRLQVIESQTAENIRLCQDAVIADAPVPFELLRCFPVKISLPCTDRFTSMLKAERMVLAEDLDWLRSHSLCSIHKIASGQTHMFSMVQPLVAGMLATALAMQRAGVGQRLRESLAKIFEDRLVVLHGPPSHQEYRDEMYRIFLPLSGPQAFQHQKQRIVLNHFLNGNISDRSRIVHFTLDESTDRENVLRGVKDALVGALLPQGIAPFFNRSKWMGGEEAVSWHGILSTHHNLHLLLIDAWAGIDRSKDIAPATEVTSAGWAAVAADITRAAPSEPMPLPDPNEREADEDAGQHENPPIESTEHDDEAGKDDWVKWNKRNRQKAVAFSESDPEMNLIVARVCMQPFVHLFHQVCQMSGQGFMRKQMLASSQGKPCSFRVVELYYGNCLDQFWENMNSVLQSRVVAFPMRAPSSGGARSLMSRMVVKGLSSVHQHLRCARTGFPQALFRVLREPGCARDILQAPVCMLDPLSEHILKMYPSEAELLSAEATAVLVAIALNYSVDTYEVERSFSEVRRRVKGKVPQTWAPSISDVAAELFTRFAHGTRTKANEFLFSGTAPKKQVRSRRRKRLRRRVAGEWQFFCKKQFKGRRFTSEDVQKARQEFQVFKTTDEYRMLKERITLAKMKANRGMSSHHQAVVDTSSLMSGPVLSDMGAIVPAQSPGLSDIEELKRVRKKHRQEKIAADQAQQEDTLTICAASTNIQSSQDFQQWSPPHQDVTQLPACPNSVSSALVGLPLVVSEFIPDVCNLTTDTWYAVRAGYNMTFAVHPSEFYSMVC